MTVIDTPSAPGPSIERPVFNILDYGADSAGFRDSTAAIQTAINAATNGGKGGIVYFPEGLYLISSTITIVVGTANSIILEGAGIGTTNIRLANNSNVDMIQFTQTSPTTFFNGLRHLALDGNRGNQTTGIGVKVINAAVSDFIFEWVSVAACRGDGINMTGAGGNFSTRFLYCVIENNTGWGVHVLANYTTIIGGYYSLNTLGGIYFHFGFVGAVIGANLLDNVGPAIQFDASQVEISNCHLENTSGATGNLIQIASGSNNHIHDNVFIGTVGTVNAVNVVVGSTSNDIIDNVISGTFTAAIIADAGTGTQIRGNRGYNPGVGIPSLRGLDNRSGVTVADGSPIVLYAVPAGANQLFDAAIEIDATAFTSGTATYTMTYTENGVAQTVVVTATVLNVVTGVRRLIQPDPSTNVTVQLTGAFVATCRLSAALLQLA